VTRGRTDRDRDLHLTDPPCSPTQLHKHNNQRPRAIACYSQAVSQMPCAVEALEALVALGMDTAEIFALVDGACRDRPDAAMYADGWVHALVTRYVSFMCREEEAGCGVTGHLT